MQNQTHALTVVKKLMMKIQNFKLMIMLEDQNIKYKNIFAKGCVRNWPE